MVNPVLFNLIFGALSRKERHFSSIEKETDGDSPYPFLSTGTFGGATLGKGREGKGLRGDPQ